MRTIELSKWFKKDCKRAKADPRHAQDVRTLYKAVALLLAEDKPLPRNYRDHAFIGNWNGYRECHLKPDLLLVYKTADPGILRIARLGSHSDIFGR
jgi:mRNA interferase YafQ